ncbi:hypothetical protein RJ640_002315, partial [Escallonia rubra]
MANQEGVPENLRKQLAIAVRSIRWSYAIFWSQSTTQQGVLEWSDGYYNGEIKTTKIVQALDIKADKVGLQRSEQLRELYKSLLGGESTDQQLKRPSIALSPEDLTDAEWYYLVCMSFVFNPGQGLPGRSLADGRCIWLCNAHCADSKVFSRSLLAKNPKNVMVFIISTFVMADKCCSSQTVACFPHFGGVIELGVTELVMEDPSLIQHIKASLLEFSKPVCSYKYPSPRDDGHDDKDPMLAKVDHEIVDTMALEGICSATEDMKFGHEGFSHLEGDIHDVCTMGSLDNSSQGSDHIDQIQDSMLDDVNGGASQVQSWHFMDDTFRNCVQGSTNFSNSASKAFVNERKAVSHTKGVHVNDVHLKELQECNHMELSSVDLGTSVDLHYIRIVSNIMRSSYCSIGNLSFHCSDNKSSFLRWKKGGNFAGHRPKEQQSMLKKILLYVPLMHGGCSPKFLEEDVGKNCLWKPENAQFHVQHARGNKSTENEKFVVLSSLIPSINKIDEVSILDDTIEYLKELEAKIEDLEPCIDVAESEAISRRNYPDTVEQISDNYANRKMTNDMKPSINKRKACDIDETEPELSGVFPKDGSSCHMKVCVNEQEVLIEMRCFSREYLLLDIIDALNSLNLDAHSVQSSSLDSVLSITIQCK